MRIIFMLLSLALMFCKTPPRPKTEETLPSENSDDDQQEPEPALAPPSSSPGAKVTFVKAKDDTLSVLEFEKGDGDFLYYEICPKDAPKACVIREARVSGEIISGLPSGTYKFRFKLCKRSRSNPEVTACTKIQESFFQHADTASEKLKKLLENEQRITKDLREETRKVLKDTQKQIENMKDNAQLSEEETELVKVLTSNRDLGEDTLTELYRQGYFTNFRRIATNEAEKKAKKDLNKAVTINAGITLLVVGTPILAAGAALYGVGDMVEKKMPGTVTTFFTEKISPSLEMAKNQIETSIDLTLRAVAESIHTNIDHLLPPEEVVARLQDNTLKMIGPWEVINGEYTRHEESYEGNNKSQIIARQELPPLTPRPNGNYQRRLKQSAEIRIGSGEEGFDPKYPHADPYVVVDHVENGNITTTVYRKKPRSPLISNVGVENGGWWGWTLNSVTSATLGAEVRVEPQPVAYNALYNFFNANRSSLVASLRSKKLDVRDLVNKLLHQDYTRQLTDTHGNPLLDGETPRTEQVKSIATVLKEKVRELAITPLEGKIASLPEKINNRIKPAAKNTKTGGMIVGFLGMTFMLAGLSTIVAGSMQLAENPDNFYARLSLRAERIDALFIEREEIIKQLALEFAD